MITKNTLNQSTCKIGKIAENNACNYLQQHGLKLIANNYLCKLGEIDLIMQDKNCLVFVEVRTRDNKSLVNSLESIDQHKQRKIIKTANYYLQQKKLMNKIPCRFDVVAVNQKENNVQYHWIKQAFDTW
jgi:putative endonuclease